MQSVLIVDDAVYMRAALKALLVRNGFKVVDEADNGKTAITKYFELRPDIVTMDVTMPEMDGVQAVKEIKKIDPQAKIVMVSAMGQEPYLREAIMSGAKNFIVKPFIEQMVLDTLRKI